jgi:hypothetical protein
MSKVSKLINDIRDTLNDPSSDRWDNDRLIRGINEACRAINDKANILRAKGSFSIVTGVSTYSLPSDVQELTRCVYGERSIDFKAHYEMDLISPTWETDIGDDIQYIVYDKLNMGQLKTYPIIASSIDSISSEYGVITELTDMTLSNPFGVLTDIYEPKEDLIIYYIKKPNEVEALNDKMPLSDSWDKAIKHYVCGITLRDDKDTQNRQFGNEELQLYMLELQDAKKESSLNYNGGAVYETPYRRW